MRTYDIETPRALFGAIAVALTAATIGLAAVLPAKTGPSERVLEIASAPTPAQAATAYASPAELRYIEAVEVIGVRGPKVISAREPDTRTKRGEQG